MTATRACWTGGCEKPATHVISGMSEIPEVPRCEEHAAEKAAYMNRYDPDRRVRLYTWVEIPGSPT